MISITKINLTMKILLKNIKMMNIDSISDDNRMTKKIKGRMHLSSSHLDMLLT